MPTPAHKIKEMEDNGSSVLALVELLLYSISEPNNTPMGLQEACKSQGKPAMYSCEFSLEGGKLLVVTPMSLNTLKKTAERVVAPGGFLKLDHIRRDALNVLSTYRKKDAQSPDYLGVAAPLADISEVRMQHLIDSFSDFTERYNGLLRITRNIIRRASEGKFNRANEERLLKEHLEQALALPKPHLKIVDQ